MPLFFKCEWKKYLVREELETKRPRAEHRCLQTMALWWVSDWGAGLAVHAESSELGWASVFNAVACKQLSNALHPVISAPCEDQFCQLWLSSTHWYYYWWTFRPGNIVLLKSVPNSLSFFWNARFSSCKERRSIVGREVHVYISKGIFLFVPQKSTNQKCFPLFLHL